MGQRACLEEEALSALEGGLPRGHLLPGEVAERLTVFWDVSIDAFDVPVEFSSLDCDTYGEYHPKRRVIVVDAKLRRGDLYKTVAHELGHHVVSQLGPLRGFRLSYRGKSKVIEELVVEKGAVAAVSNEPIARGQGWRLLALGLYHKMCKVYRSPGPNRISFYGWYLDSRCPLLS